MDAHQQQARIDADPQGTARGTFVLLDHSLRRLGGHHFDNAQRILESAAEAGYRIVLATHHRFHRQGLLPAHWLVIPCFRHTTYDNPALAVNLRSSPRGEQTEQSRQPPGLAATTALWAGLVRALERWRASRALARRQRSIGRFARCCRKLFKQIPLQAGDHVLLPTLSEMDLLGLAQYWREAPGCLVADWHLQFHWKIFDGREPDYPQQAARREMLRQHFLEALDHTRGERLHFYTTTPQLQKQYNALGVAHFHHLPYPINPAFRQVRRSQTTISPRLPEHPGKLGETPPPLRITCAGALGRAKKKLLGQLLDKLWQDFFAPGRMQLLVKSNKWWYRVPVPPRRTGTGFQGPRSNSARVAPVDYVPHPLRPEDYVHWIHQADIALFLHDPERYYAVLSGVLEEFLAAGVPVLVPAGCWLAEQIAEPVYQHQLQLLNRLPVIYQVRQEEVTWQGSGVGAAGEKDRPGRMTFADLRAPAVGHLAMPDGAAEFLVTFRWFEPTEPGTYIRLRVDQFDARGGRVDAFSSIVGHRSDQQAVPILVHLHNQTAQLRLSWENAYHPARVVITHLKCYFLCRSPGSSGHCPYGAVGLMAADVEQVPRLLRDMAEHSQHYRKTAAIFANSWMEQHHPHRTLAQLLANGHSSRSGGCPRPT